MVTGSAIACMVAAGLLAGILPIALLVFLLARKKIRFLSVLSGMVVFLLFQYILRMNLLRLFMATDFYHQYFSDPLINGLILSATAGVFEEFGRWCAFAFVLRRQLDWSTGLGFGLGHGAFESVTLLGLSSINNIMVALAINNGTLEALLKDTPSFLISNIRDTMVNMPPSMFLLGGVERVMTMIVHVALSFIVMDAVRRRQFRGVVGAMLLHTLVNYPTVVLAQFDMVALSELYLLLVAVAALVYLTRCYRFYRSKAV